MDPRNQQGASAESDAVQLLIASGYRIVDRNFRCKTGELDIVARDGDALVFVEVRSRSDDEHGSAAEMVRRTKQRRVIRVARAYLAGLIGLAGADSAATREPREPPFTQCRFDVVAITAGEPILIKDAFRVR